METIAESKATKASQVFARQTHRLTVSQRLTGTHAQKKDGGRAMHRAAPQKVLMAGSRYKLELL